MGLFNFIFGKHPQRDTREQGNATSSGMPAWATALPARTRPSKAHIESLESIRQQLGVTDDEYFAFIWTHPETTRKVLRMGYRNLVRSDRSESTEDHFTALLAMRYNAATIGADEPPPLSMNLSGDMEPQIRAIVRRFDDVDELIDFVIEDEEQHRSHPVESARWAFEKISAILAVDTEELTWTHGQCPT